MATCKAVVVLCPNGRRVNVKIVPNATISKILEEVCKKQGLNPKEHGIKHQRKVLDNTLPVKFSNLSNNAHLELVSETTPVRQGGSCTLALQLENGERLIHSFQASTTLWDILIHWDSQAERESELKLTNRMSSNTTPLSPVCVYMAHEIQGEKLKSTTLQSIGLSSGRAVLRLVHREASEVDVQLSSHNISSQESSESNIMDIDKQTDQLGQSSSGVFDENLVSDDKNNESLPGINAQQNQPDQLNSEISVPQEKKERVDLKTKEKFDMTTQPGNASSITSNEPVKNASQELSVNDNTRNISCTSSGALPFNEEDIPAIDFTSMLEQERQRLRPKLDKKAQRRPETDFNEPKRLKIEHRPAPLFADFKFPEGKAEEKAHLLTSSAAPDGLEDVSCDRQLLVYSLDALPSAQDSSQQEDLPDEFFEVTVDDLRRMLNQLNRDKMKQDSAPLLTKSQREAHEKAQMEKYTRVVIRVYFPDRLVLQGFFRPHEKVSAITQFVMENLQIPTTKFYIYIAPPKRVLDKPEMNLFEAKLCPAAVVYFGCTEKQDHFLSAHHISGISSVLEAEQAVHRVMSADRSSSDTSLDSLTHKQTKQYASSSTTESKKDTTTHSSKKPNSGSSSAPKWFKMGKK